MIVSPPSPGSTWAGSNVVASSSAAWTNTSPLTSPSPPPVVAGASPSSVVVAGASLPSVVESVVPPVVQAAATTARATSTVHHRVDLRLVLIASLLLSSRRHPAPPAAGHNRLLSRSCNLYEQTIVAADSSQYDHHPATGSQEVDSGPLRHQDTDSSHDMGQDARSVDSGRRRRGFRVGVELRSFLPDSGRHQWALSGG